MFVPASPRRRKASKPYCEAFPSIDVWVLRAHIVRGAMACQWLTEHGKPSGHIRNIRLDQEALAFDYMFLGTVNVGRCSGSCRMRIVEIARESYTNEHPYLACPGCGRATRTVYFVDQRWACRTCHHLRNLTTRLSPVVRKRLERWQLTQKVGGGRPRYMRADRYVPLRKRLGELDRELGPGPAEPLPREWSFEQQPRWLSDESDLMTSVDDADEDYWWMPAGPGGFERQRLVARARLGCDEGSSDT